MESSPPEVVIRLGSHAEKEYVIKLANFLDGLIVGANLFEATPGATASLLVKVSAKNAKLYVDPMTYAYGAYIDPNTGKVRRDLDWIKSEQTVQEKPKKKGDKDKKPRVRDFKRSYKRLADAMRGPLIEAVETSTAVSIDAFGPDEILREFCESVTSYQLNRISREFEEEEELRDFLEDMPRPTAVFAPYFYIEPTAAEAWLDLNLRLMTQSAGLAPGVPVHGVVCADVSSLASAEFRNRLEVRVPATGVSGVWFWFSGFFEETADADLLSGYRNLIQELSTKLEVHSMHGGFFSLSLSKFGLKGVSHGVGYGEQKDVVPVIGQSTPMVRYYLPALARRLGVPQIERAFDALGIRRPEDFHDRVCDCAVCRGVVQVSLSEFSAFGETHYSRSDSKRKAQTPAAARRCRFHFLLSRIRERDELRRMSLADVVERLERSANTWGRQPSLRESATHLLKWAAVLKSEQRTIG